MWLVMPLTGDGAVGKSGGEGQGPAAARRLHGTSEAREEQEECGRRAEHATAGVPVSCLIN